MSAVNIEFDTKHWKPTYYFPTDYLISDNGKLYNIKTKQVVKGKNDRGYRYYCLSKNGKKRYVSAHRLVALAFIPNPENKPHVDHINCVRDDNRVENLRWVTPYENVHNPITIERVRKQSRKNMELLFEQGKNGHGAKPGKKTGGDKIEVYKDGILVGTFNSQTEAAEFVGVCFQTVSSLVLGKNKKCRKGYTFKRISKIACKKRYENGKT